LRGFRVEEIEAEGRIAGVREVDNVLRTLVFWVDWVLVGVIISSMSVSLGTADADWRSGFRLRRKGFGKSEYAWEETEDCADEEILLMLMELFGKEIHKEEEEGIDAGERILFTEQWGVHLCDLKFEFREREKGFIANCGWSSVTRVVRVLGRRGGAEVILSAPSPTSSMANFATENRSLELEGIKDDRSKLVR
jgi:hypothetical protein